MKKVFKSILMSVFVMSLMSNVFAKGEKIVVEGSTTVLPIAQRCAEEFMNRNTNAEINVRGGGSGVGISSLISGTCDIADSSRPIKEEELKKAAGKGKDIKASVIAMDGIAVIINPVNPIKALSKKQIQNIYTGKISNWKELGGMDRKIVVISRDSASGTFEAFAELALNKQKVRPDALMQASNQAIATIVGNTSDAIGYVGLGYITSKVKAIDIDGVSASRITVLTGKYPYSRPLFMYTNGAPKGQIKNFIDFILSDEGQKMVEEEGFVSLK
jgi:phosphate transport system substrate-binding protein